MNMTGQDFYICCLAIGAGLAMIAGIGPGCRLRVPLQQDMLVQLYRN